MSNQYHNVTDESLLGSILLLQKDADELDSKIKIAKNAMIDRKRDSIAAALQKKAEPFGAVSEVVESAALGNQKITFTTPKKVTWNQDGLHQIWQQMIADGADPSEYLEISFKISEDKYKNWPGDMKKFFEPYRTVEPGNVALKIEPAKEK